MGPNNMSDVTPNTSPEILEKRILHLEQEMEREKQHRRILKSRLLLMEYALDHTMEELLQKTLDEV